MKLSWIKLYTEARIDAKLRSLPMADRWVWLSLLCYASEQETRGVITGLPIKLVAVEVADGDVEALKRTCNALHALHALQVDFSDENAVEIAFPNFEKRQRVRPSESPEAKRERTQKARAKALEEKRRLEAQCSAPVARVKRTEARKEAEQEQEKKLASTPAVGFEDCIATAMDELGDQAAESIRAQKADFAAKLELRPGVVAWYCLEAAIVEAGAKLKRNETIRNLAGFLMRVSGDYLGVGIPPKPVVLAPKPPVSIYQDLSNYEGI